MAKGDAKSNYTHFVPAAKRVSDWYKRYNFVLVTSMEQLDSIFKEANWTPGKSFISFDTETTDLNPEELDIVGYSFCIDGVSTYYVPVNHFQYEFNLGEIAVEYIYNRMCEAKKVFMYNARFDIRTIEFYGFKDNKDKLDKSRWNYVKYDMSKVPIMDVMNAVWNADTNIKMPSLKDSSLHYLGYEQMHFDEVVESAGNFYYLNPSENPDTVYYAGADALCTYLLVPAVMKYYKESGLAGQLDDAVIYPLMHYESEKLWLDYDKICSMYEECKNSLEEAEKLVYDTLGYQINLNSPVQVAQALERLGIDTGEKTESGKMAIGVKVLERVSDEVRQKFPALDAYIKYKELGKLQSTYFTAYKKEFERRGYLRGSYKTTQVPTGRLSCGTDTKNTYFSPCNLQAIPKPHVKMYDVFDLGNRSLISKKDKIILGYQFKLSQYDENKKHIVPDDERYIGQSEGMDPHLNVRSCITPKMYEDSGDDEFIYCSADYAAEEIRLTANISREPVWLDALVSGGDVHKSTAIALWGEENYNRDYRKKAKGANFCSSVDNKILTANRGYIRAGDIRYTDILYNRAGKEVRIQGIQGLEDQKCYEVVFDSGLKASFHEKHKLLCWDGEDTEWVRVKDLTERHQIITYKDKNNTVRYRDCTINTHKYNSNSVGGSFIDINSMEFAYLMGLYLSNGYLNINDKIDGDTYINLCVNDRDMVDSIKYLIRTIGIKDEFVIVSGGGYANKLTQIRISEVGFVKMVSLLFGKNSNKYIPGYTFESWDSDSMKYFLGGYLLNNSVHYNDMVTEVSFRNTDVLHSVALMCNYLGIRTHIGTNVNTLLIYEEDTKETSTWYLSSVHKKTEYTGDIVAIECATNEYIDTSMCSHNSILYGAGASSFNDPKYDIYTLADAEEFYNNYKKALPTLFQWEDRVQRRARKNGFVNTYFGRPRRVKGYYDNHNTAFANRTAVNTMIQGCHVYDNLVLTNYGYIKIGKLYDEFQSISQDMDKWKYKVWNGFEWCDFFPVYRDKDVKFKLRFEGNRIVECDSRHKVKILKGDKVDWVYVSDLKEMSDRVCFDKHYGYIKGGKTNIPINGDDYIEYDNEIDGYEYHVIKGVEQTGEEVDTYTLCVLNDLHQYVCEGMISHNTAGDLLKLVLVKLWKRLLNNPEYKDDVRFMITIHDEIGYSVRASRLEEILGIIEDTQTVKLAEWPAPIIAEPSIGFSVGEIWDFHRVDDKDSPLGYRYVPNVE